jgi:uncharacterized protein (TIGR02147 family)
MATPTQTDPPPPPDVFAYLDYRAYLAEAWAHLRLTDPARATTRALAEAAGLASPTFLSAVVKGERALGTHGTDGIIRAFRLTDREATYFRDLVSYNDGPKGLPQEQALDRLKRHRFFRAAEVLVAARYEYLSRWYFPVIREMIRLQDFTESPREIARRLRGKVSARAVREAVARLAEFGLVRRTGDGRLVQSDEALVKTGHEVPRHNGVTYVLRTGVVAYHRTMLELAERSLVDDPPKERHFNALTFAVAAHRVPELKKRMNALVEEVAALAEEDTQRDTVYQLSLALFPLTRAADDADDLDGGAS